MSTSTIQQYILKILQEYPTNENGERIIKTPFCMIRETKGQIRITGMVFEGAITPEEDIWRMCCWLDANKHIAKTLVLDEIPEEETKC